jgi:hypothetical protein
MSIERLVMEVEAELSVSRTHSDDIVWCRDWQRSGLVESNTQRQST